MPWGRRDTTDRDVEAGRPLLPGAADAGGLGRVGSEGAARAGELGVLAAVTPAEGEQVHLPLARVKQSDVAFHGCRIGAVLLIRIELAIL